MKLCLISDLHIDMHRDGGVEFVSQLVIPEHDILVIAGDLSQTNHWRYVQNIKDMCDKSPHVLYVLGNHDCYSSTITEVDCFVHGLTKVYKNLTIASRAKILTNKDIPALGELSLLAGTLWFPDNYDQGVYKVLLNDFNYIEDIEPEIYRRNTRFGILLHSIKDEPCIVVSHHLPSYRSVNPRFANSPINRFFVGGEFDDVIESSQIRCWLHGHSHDAVDYKIGNTRVVSNPVGYPHEIPHSWEPLIIDIP